MHQDWRYLEGHLDMWGKACSFDGQRPASISCLLLLNVSMYLVFYKKMLLQVKKTYLWWKQANVLLTGPFVIASGLTNQFS